MLERAGDSSCLAARQETRKRSFPLRRKARRPASSWLTTACSRSVAAVTSRECLCTLVDCFRSDTVTSRITKVPATRSANTAVAATALVVSEIESTHRLTRRMLRP